MVDMPSGDFSNQCISDESLQKWIIGELNEEERGGLIVHTAACRFCAAKAAGAIRWNEDQPAPAAVPAGADKMMSRSASKTTGSSAGPVSGKIWVALTALCLIASFLVRPYYKQFLVLTLLFGLKSILRNGREGIRTIFLQKSDPAEDGQSEKNTSSRRQNLIQ